MLLNRKFTAYPLNPFSSCVVQNEDLEGNIVREVPASYPSVVSAQFVSYIYIDTLNHNAHTTWKHYVKNVLGILESQLSPTIDLEIDDISQSVHGKGLCVAPQESVINT